MSYPTHSLPSIHFSLEECFLLFFNPLTMSVYTSRSSYLARGHGSRHSAWGDQFNMLPSILCLFLHWWGPKSIAKLDGGHVRICSPLAPPLSMYLNV